MKPDIHEIEAMLFVLFLVAAVLGLGIYSMSGISCSRSRDRLVESDFKTFDSALAMYRLNAGSYPSTGQGLKSLCEEPSIPPARRRWSKLMDRIPLDPWGNPYVYRFIPESENPATWEIISTGPDGTRDTGDDLSTQDD